MLFREPKVAASLLALLIEGGIYTGSAVLKHNEYEEFHNCTNAICQTFESENTKYDARNGGWTTYHDGKAKHHANSDWVKQQKAIRNYHKCRHEDSA